jgi:hypothetical protein
MTSPRLTLLFSALLALPVLVINNNDSGPGSLRQAIADAAPGDTLTFDSALDGQIITLGANQLLIDKDLTLPTFPGLDYQLEHQPDLSLPFVGLDSPITATDFMTTFEVTLDSGKDFVRAARK